MANIDAKLIARINELAHKKKTEGLSDAETHEQQELRAQYLQAFRSGFANQLEHIRVIDPLGNDVTPKKKKKTVN